MDDMRTMLSLWLILFAITVECIRFPTKDENMLLAITEYSERLRLFDPSDGSNARIKRSFRLQGNGRHSASFALDFNYNEGLIYYTDLLARKIYSLKVETGEINMIYSGYLRSMEGLAYDWIHGNLYVCDWSSGKVVVINPATGSSKTIHEFTYPRDMVVDPINGWLILSVGDERNSSLRRISLDGQYDEKLRNLKSGRGLSLDYDDQKLYIVETDPAGKISSVDFNGRNKRRLYRNRRGFMNSPEKITSFEDKFYWTVLLNSAVKYANKTGGTVGVFRRVVVGGDDTIGGILAIHPSRQPQGESKCGDNNGGCSHFCLPVKYSLRQIQPYSCECPGTMVLEIDNRTCSSDI